MPESDTHDSARPTIDHELKIAAPPAQVFAALTTLDGVKGWHTPNATGTGEVGSEWVFSFADHPEFGWEVIASEAPRARRVALHPWPWRFRGHHRDLHARADRRRSNAASSYVHAGWPGTHGNFRKCNTTWGVLLHHLRDYVETGAAAPAFE